MTATTVSRFITTVALLTALAGGGTARAEERSLVKIHRGSPQDRSALLEADVPLIAETEDALIAVGSAAGIAAAASDLGLTSEVVEASTENARYALAGLRPGATETDLLVCGVVVARGDGWRLVREIDFTSAACSESSGWFLRVLDMEVLAPYKAPPEIDSTRLVPHPLVQEMVDRVDTSLALAHWSALTTSPTWNTRHSASQGCVEAAGYVHDLFTAFGLETEYQHHTSGYADNVIGTRLGLTEPELVYIAIGHLDDLPSSGPAPGADDNASGTAMVTALAEIMSDYCFARTTKFLAVTGEEQGLHGSEYYADDAAARGEDIQAVLNGDMIGWEGDGYPVVEDLDVNYNTASQWLAQAMVDAAADYTTGLTLNAFPCSTMTYSDHAPFWSNGYSAICGITDNEGFCGHSGNYPYYHQSSDTIANCGPGAPAFEASVIRTYLATMAHLAQPIARVPAAPSGLSAQPDGDNTISLSWSDQGPGVSYRIYRSVGGCADPEPPVLVGETGSTSFVDSSASGGVAYAYTLAATVAGGCSSAVSSCVDASTTGLCDEAPRFAGIETVTNAAFTSCQLNLGWQPPQDVWCGGPVVYNVYRSSTAGFTPSAANRIAGSLSGTAFYDNDVVDSETYHYIVRAEDLAGGGEDDNIHGLSAAPSGPNIVGPWSDDAGDNGPATLVPTAPWSVSPGAGRTGAAYATGAYGNNLCVPLTTPTIPLGANPQLQFWTRHEIENAWDKGELQITTNGGASWQRVPLTYPGNSSYTSDACNLGVGTFFTGLESEYSAYTADLTVWANQNVSLRWLLSTDTSVNGAGWWIDEISITDYSVCTSNGAIFADGFESGDTTAWSP
jgi:hypothetical protein